MKLATQTTGRGGSGSPAAKAQQALIVQLLEQHGVAAEVDRRGTVSGPIT
jgi:hypothetical protein